MHFSGDGASGRLGVKTLDLQDCLCHRQGLSITRHPGRPSTLLDTPKALPETAPPSSRAARRLMTADVGVVINDSVMMDTHTHSQRI